MKFLQILVVLCMVALISGQTIQPVPTGDIDESIYDMIESVLREMFPEDEAKVLCMAEDIKKNKIVDRFFTKEILDDRDALQKEVRVYSPNAEANCKKGIPSHQTETTEVIQAPESGFRRRQEENPWPSSTNSSCGKSGFNTFWFLLIGVAMCIHA